MEFSSERIKVVLSKTSNYHEHYKIRIFPSRRYLINSDNAIVAFNFDVQDIESDIDIFSLTEKIIDSIESDEDAQLSSVSPLFDTTSIVYTGFSTCIASFTFKYEDLANVGLIEKQLIYFDLKYSGKVTSITLLIIEALCLTRKAFKWKDVWDVDSK